MTADEIQKICFDVSQTIKRIAEIEYGSSPFAFALFKCNCGQGLGVFNRYTKKPILHISVRDLGNSKYELEVIKRGES